MAKKKAEVFDEVLETAEPMAAEEPAEVEAEVEAKPKKEEDLVTIMIPYIEGESKDQEVIINGHITIIKKGEMVQVKRNVAEVIANSNKQMKEALKNQEKFKMQVQEW